jgi:hypothetical protein
MQNRQADFAEIRRMRQISLKFPMEIVLTASFEDGALCDAFPLTAKNPNVTVARISVEVRKIRLSIEICKPC